MSSQNVTAYDVKVISGNCNYKYKIDDVWSDEQPATIGKVYSVNSGSTFSVKITSCTQTGYTFDKWQLDGSDVSGSSSTGEASTAIYTTHVFKSFIKVKTYSVSLSKDPSDVSSTLSCTPNPVNYGKNITLKATVSDKYNFEKWTISYGTERIYKYTSECEYGPVYQQLTAKASFLIKKFTVKFNLNGNTSQSPISDISVSYGGQAYIQNIVGYTETKENNIVARFYKTKDSESAYKEIELGKPSRAFTFTNWKDSDGNTYSGGSTITNITSDISLTAQYSGGDWIGYPVSSLPDISRTGYTFVKWIDSDGNSVTTTSPKYTSDATIYASWEPKTYSFKYVVDSTSGEKWDSEVHDSTVEKTYGSNKQLTTVGVSKFGYTFKGWKCIVNNTEVVYKKNSKGEIWLTDDKAYNQSQYVNLYPYFEPTPNICSFNYYYEGSTWYKTVTEEYNIEMTKYTKGSPNEGMGNDSVFAGWYPTYSDKNPPEWFNENKGVFQNESKLPEIVENYNPLVIYPNSISEWNGSTTYYWATWKATGKYFKVDGEWKKVSTAYVKVSDDQENEVWKPISDLWIKTENGWKKEIELKN